MERADTYPPYPLTNNYTPSTWLLPLVVVRCHLVHVQFISNIHRAEGRNGSTKRFQVLILNPNTSIPSFLGLSVPMRLMRMISFYV
jgi:hypothetical protein